MTRKELEDLKLSNEQIDAVLKINEADITNEKNTSSAELKNLQTEVKGLQTQVADRDRQLETLKATAGDNEALTKQIADLQAENAKAKETHEAEVNQLKIDYAVEKALTGAKAKNLAAAKALLDIKDAKLDKDGSVKGLQEQIDKLVADEGTKFLFETQQAKQTFKGYQPGASSEQKQGEVDTSKMNYDELCAYLAENPDANLE